MALCAGLDGRPTFGEVLEECVKLADEQQMRDALKGTGDMTKAEPTAVHATAEYLEEAGCRHSLSFACLNRGSLVSRHGR